MKRDGRGRFVRKAGPHHKKAAHKKHRRNPVVAAPLLAKAAMGAKLKGLSLGAGRAARVLLVR
jgi:hypothetical protein